MKKWLVLGLGALAVAWAPFLYSELARDPGGARAAPSRNTSPLAVHDELEEEHAEEAEAEPDEAPAAAPEPVAEAKPPEAPAPQAPAPAAPSEEKAAAAAPPAAEDREQDEQDDEESEVVRVVLPSKLLPAFERAFESEPRDPFWAAGEEPRLSQLFQASGAPHASLRAVVCRKSVCRLAFAELEPEVESKLFGAVREEFGDKLALDLEAGDAPALLYLLRKGYELEPHAQ